VLHAKAVVADDQAVFIGSANVTEAEGPASSSATAPWLPP